MEKGKPKKHKKYLSIIFVPHFTGKVKVVKFTSFYSRLFGLLAFLLSILVAVGLFFGYTYNKNLQLEKELSKLTEVTVEQNKLLNEKALEIDSHIQKEEDINSKIKEFTDKYKEITDNYITNRTSTVKTNRSADRTDRSFIDDIKDLKEKLDVIDDAKKFQGEASSVITDTEKKLEKYTDSIPTLWPTSGRISSPFGGRPDPFQFTSKFHSGIDLAAQYGQDITASGSGQVIFAGWYSGYGNAVIIDHGHSITTLYGHCSKLIAKKDQVIKKGDLIAKVGSTGRSTGVHLHFEVRLSGNPVDPLKYLD